MNQFNEWELGMRQRCSNAIIEMQNKIETEMDHQCSVMILGMKKNLEDLVQQCIPTTSEDISGKFIVQFSICFIIIFQISFGIRYLDTPKHLKFSVHPIL